MNVSVASRLKTLTSKLILKWLTELQKTAQLAELACQSALSALFQRVTSTRSIRTLVSIAVLAQTLALWVQSYLENNFFKSIKKAKAMSLGFFCISSQDYTYSLGADVTSMKLFCASTA